MFGGGAGLKGRVSIRVFRSGRGAASMLGFSVRVRVGGPSSMHNFDWWLWASRFVGRGKGGEGGGQLSKCMVSSFVFVVGGGGGALSMQFFDWWLVLGFVGRGGARSRCSFSTGGGGCGLLGGAGGGGAFLDGPVSVRVLCSGRGAAAMHSFSVRVRVWGGVIDA